MDQYHYRECGLDNIWLINGYTIHQTAYGEGVSIHNTKGLHDAIGKWVIAQAKPLFGAELRFLRLEMELTQKQLSDFLGVQEQALRRWEKARSKPINGSADRLLRAIYKEYVNGNGTVRQMVDRLTQIEIHSPTTAKFKEGSKGWNFDLKLSRSLEDKEWFDDKPMGQELI